MKLQEVCSRWLLCVLWGATSTVGRNPLSPLRSFVPHGGSRILAKNEKETSNLEVSLPLSQSFKVSDREAPLMNDIEMLSNILAEIVQSEDPKVHDIFIEFRDYGLERAADSTDVKALKKMINRASKLSPDEALGVMRSFSIMLNLVNIAEVHHRNRMLRQHELGNVVSSPLPLTEDSIRGTIDALLESGLATKEQIYDQLARQKAEIVLTAHPTQVQRKSLLRKYREVTELLAYMERPDVTDFDREAAHSDLRRIISSIWGADEIRRRKPTPQQEASGGHAVLESVLWDAVPSYLRKLDAQCRLALGRSLPVDVVPIKFSSWIGGDRDGKNHLVSSLARSPHTPRSPRQPPQETQT